MRPRTRVRDWMSADPVTVTSQTSVLNARRLLQAYGIRHLPVVTEGDRIVGILSDRDLLVYDGQINRALSALQSDLVWGRYRHVEGVMTAPARTVAPEDPLMHAAQLMLEDRHSALPVVVGDRVVGIITTTDCLRALLAGVGMAQEPARWIAELDVDPDAVKATPMPPGDDRPGRAVPAAPAAAPRASRPRARERV